MVEKSDATSHELDKPSSHELDKPSSHELDKPSSHELKVKLHGRKAGESK